MAEGGVAAAKKRAGTSAPEYVEQTWPEFDFAPALHEYAAAQTVSVGSAAAAERGARGTDALSHRGAGRAFLWRLGPLGRRSPAARARDGVRAGRKPRARTVPGGLRTKCSNRGRAMVDGLGYRPPAVRLSRDVQLPFVFACLAAHWRPHAPIAEMSYRDFVRRMRGVVRHRGNLGFAERRLFAPWDPPCRACASRSVPGAWRAGSNPC